MRAITWLAVCGVGLGCLLSIFVLNDIHRIRCAALAGIFPLSFSIRSAMQTLTRLSS